MAIWTPTNKTEKADLIKDLKKMADSIDDEKVQKETGKRLITNEEATKLAGLENYDDTKLKEAIEEQSTKIEELEEEIEALYGDFEPGKASGEIATINDGVDKSRVEVQGDGNSYQDTREGYNYFKVNPQPKLVANLGNGVFSFVNSQQVSINSYDNNNINFTTNTVSCLGFLSEPISLKSGETLKITGILNGSTSLRSNIVTLREDGSYNALFSSNKIISTSNIEYSYTATEDIDVCVGFWTNGDTTYTIDLTNLMATTKADASYEQYGSKPSTDFPSDIEVIDGVNRIGKATLRTTGKGVELTNNEDGSFTLNGTSTDSVWVDFETDIKDVGDYKVSFNKNRNISSFGGDVRLCIYNGETKLNDTTLINKANYNVIFEEGNLPTHAGIWLNKGNTFDNFTFYPSITKGKSDKPYVPEGHIGLLQRNQQLYDYTNAKDVGAGVTVDDEGWITMSCDNTSGTSTRFLNYFSRKLYGIKPSTEYNFILEIKSVSGNGDITVSSADNYSPSQFKWWSCTMSTLKSGDVMTKIIMSSDDVVNTHCGVRTYLQMGAGKSGSITFRISVLRNLEVTAETFKYTPYQENLIPIDLQGNTLAKVGDIKDLLNIGLDGSVSIEKKNKEKALTGDEAYALETSDIYKRFNLGISDIVNIQARNTNVKSNYFKSTVDNGYSVIMAYENRALFYPTSDITTVEEFKALVKEKYDSGKPIKILYVLKDESIETINLPSIKPIKLFEGTNNFELVTNLDTTLEVSYRKSNNKRLKALESAVLSIGGNV